MSDRLDIRPEHLAMVRSLLRAHAPSPAKVWAFGSRTLGAARTYSDLDLAIDAGRPLTLAEHADLTAAFEEAALPWRVDVVDWAATSNDFRRPIERQRVAVAVLPSNGDEATTIDEARF
ncbi:MAG: nucleotidyltransferase domain-containing protein [Rhodospirillales bacterium]|nr:nucleotidyltransferase domain-containing protein [Rhodospirillales bacterium]